MQAAQDAVLAVDNLTKTYTTFKKEAGLMGGVKALFQRQMVAVPAVQSLNFTVRRGEFIGLLGPNGAGKTTTLKMLTGLIKPSGGRAVAFGQFDTARRRPDYLRRIGMVMGQRNQLNPDLPAIDSFRLAQAIYAIEEDAFQRRLKLCEDLFGVGRLIYTSVRKLSLGERMKMELILAILHEPELLFLDEPTIGLDFHAARQIRTFLAETNQRLGITVILTSHYTKDIEELCRRVILINHGQLVYDGALADMDQRFSAQKVVSLTLKDAGAAERAAAVIATLNAPELQVALAQGDPGSDAVPNQVSFDVGVKHAAAVLAKVIERLGGDSVVDLKVGERPLDEVFGAIYQQQPPATVPEER